MLLRTAPWRRAPALALRSPGVFVACLLAMLALAAAASSGVLFLASVGTGALRDLAAGECDQDAQPAISDDRGPIKFPSGAQAPANFGRTDRTVRVALGAQHVATPYVVAMSSAAVSASPVDTVTVFARDGAAGHVDVVEHTSGRGAIVPLSFATARHLQVGSTMQLGSTHVPVTGVYRDIAPSAFDPTYVLPRYWCAWSDEIVPTIYSRPPPFVLVDRSTLLAAGQAVTATWYVPTRAGESTVPALTDVLARTEAATETLRPVQDFHTTSDLPYLLGKAQRERTGLSGATVPINVAGVLATGLLVAAAGSFWGVRRQREIRLLTTRGVGRVGIGVKAALELAPALIIGTFVGWATAIALVAAFGPAPDFEPGAIPSALGLAALAGCGALLTAATLGAAAVPRNRPRRRLSWVRLVPWEAGFLVAGVLTYRNVRTNGSVDIGGGTVHVNPLVLTFPLLALTGGVVLCARASAVSLKLGRRVGTGLPDAAYLAFRRLAGTPAVALGTVIGVALPLGVLVYSAALSGSTGDTVQRKYETNVGAPHAFGTLAAPGSTPRIGQTGTVVTMIQIDSVIDGGEQVRVLGVDQRTFTRFAYGGDGLRSDLQLLETPGNGVATLLVNAPTGTNATVLDIRGEKVPLRVVGRRASFPGDRNPYAPMLVVDRADLPRHLPLNTDRREEVWTDDAHTSALLAALKADDVTPNYEITPQTFLSSTGLRPLTWIFGYLRSLAYLTGLMALTALAFAFTARTRRRAMSYHLARRMGLSRASHRRSIALEVGGLVAFSWLVGIALSVATVVVVYRFGDPYPAFPPPPVLPVPIPAIAISAVIALAAVGVATAALQAVIDRVRPAELLRTG